MDNIDFQDEEIKKLISELSYETGMSLEEIINEYKNIYKNMTYVRFISGKYKGLVGYVLPTIEAFPYAIEVHTKDSIIWCPRWETELETISREEYEKAMKEQIND